MAFDPKLGGPPTITFNHLEDWTKRPEEGVRYYSGVATYQKTFDFAADLSRNAKVFLDLGAVHDLCRVRLNGQDLGIVWTAPWRVDISSAVQVAGNQLEIEVVNGWVNRLIGDQQPGNKGVRQGVLAIRTARGQEPRCGSVYVRDAQPLQGILAASSSRPAGASIGAQTGRATISRPLIPPD